MISTSVRLPKQPGSGVPRPTDLTETSHDVSNRIGPIPCQGQRKLPSGGVLGYRTPTLPVPSKFYVREGFPRTTGDFEFPKSGPLRDRCILPGSIEQIKTTRLHPTHKWRGLSAILL